MPWKTGIRSFSTTNQDDQCPLKKRIDPHAPNPGLDPFFYHGEPILERY
jgi:hypothetical protein